MNHFLEQLKWSYSGALLPLNSTQKFTFSKSLNFEKKWKKSATVLYERWCKSFSAAFAASKFDPATMSCCNAKCCHPRGHPKTREMTFNIFLFRFFTKFCNKWCGIFIGATAVVVEKWICWIFFLGFSSSNLSKDRMLNWK